MTALSQSHFLQALGWAILNSFWQMGALWLAFSFVRMYSAISARHKYAIAIGTVVVGTGLFVLTALRYGGQLNAGTSVVFAAIPAQTLAAATFTAALLYIALLLIPAWQWLRNLYALTRIRSRNSGKGLIEHRLFVQKTALHLGIKKRVDLLIGATLSSPVTVGFFKPIILLPFAVLNQLSVQQMEAVLLHELAHIRRHDYLINLFLSLIQTVFYFNPFTRFFIDAIAAERECCCDETVLQFGYDRQSYASALYLLGKAAHQHQLMLGAAGKKTLLQRIEKILGTGNTGSRRPVALVPAFIALALMVLLNSLLIIKDKQPLNLKENYVAALLPFYVPETAQRTKVAIVQDLPLAKTSKPVFPETTVEATRVPDFPTDLPPELPLSQVTYDDVSGQLSAQARMNVETALSGTKKYLGIVQWNEINASIGDVLTPQEKRLVKQQYLKELKAVNWHNIEENLKSNYDKLNWPAINANLKAVMATVALDSIQQQVNQVLFELEKENRERLKRTNPTASILPDVSLAELDSTRSILRNAAQVIDKMKPKKIVRL